MPIIQGEGDGMMCGKCDRCGTEQSTFWYPYGFAVAPIPNIADRCTDRAQYFTLCDECQTDLINFMRMKITQYYDPAKLKRIMENNDPMPFKPVVNE